MDTVVHAQSCKGLDDAMRACKRCESLIACNPVDPRKDDTRTVPRPIVSGVRSKPVLLLGQAPGIDEYHSGKPFQGDAGQQIRDIFDDLGLPRARFDSLVYSSATIKCFPGSKPKLRENGTREDAVPSAAMLANCRPFLEQQFELVKPRVLVTLGLRPLQSYFALRGRKTSGLRLEDYVGESEDWNGTTVVFFPHTSGVSRWHNDAGNKALFRQAKALLRTVFIEGGIAQP